MTQQPWLLYGATGYTGVLIAEEAVRRGHRPILAGRSAEKLRALAQRLGLEYRVAGLDSLERVVAENKLVLHAAGPFAYTSAPMVTACLRRGAHYLDITGEVPVFEAIFARAAEAQAAGVMLLPGVGFDVVPSDCLARSVADQLPGATELEIAVAGTSGLSAGTLKSALEHLPRGAVVRRQGRLVPHRLGADTRRVTFFDGTRPRHRTALLSTWGDLSTAYRSTGIPNITTYLSFPPQMTAALRWAGPALQMVMRAAPVRRLAQAAAGRAVAGPDQTQREQTPAFAWARAVDPAGRACEAWLVTPETYYFTALSALACVERVLAQPQAGAFTPAQAFGADFVVEVPGVRRFAALPAIG